VAKNYTLRIKEPSQRLLLSVRLLEVVCDGLNSAVLLETPVTVHIYENITPMSEVRERHDAIHSMDMKLQLAALR
jgi:hypothetical protein